MARDRDPRLHADTFLLVHHLTQAEADRLIGGARLNVAVMDAVDDLCDLYDQPLHPRERQTLAQGGLVSRVVLQTGCGDYTLAMVPPLQQTRLVVTVHDQPVTEAAR